jgi:hypothetical protein
MGYFFLRKKMLKEFNSTASFSKFIQNSVKYLVILPLNDADFANSFDIVKYLKIHKKSVTLFIPEYRVNSISNSREYKIISYDFNQINKIGLPNKQFLESLKQYEFDVLIDLERDENLFLAAIASFVKANYKVGFAKPEIENLYNFQLVNTKINSEISYRNLLNSLKMF